ncbi:MAG: enoyl-CoA hydratase/isomerase family protein [Acidimicrobiales bacterium]
MAVDVERDCHGAVARITVPGDRWDGEIADALVAAIGSLVEDREVRVVILASRSTGFCTGLADGFEPLTVDPDPAAALARLRPPVMAVIDGPCLSVGLEVALAADLRLCSPAATFALPDLERDRLPCWGGTQRLARAIRPAEATAMVLLGSTLDADRALALGLVHEVADQPASRAAELVGELTARGPLALEMAKEAVHRGAELPLRHGLRLEGDLNHQLAATQDRAEGLQAFFDKRPPDFAGR